MAGDMPTESRTCRSEILRAAAGQRVERDVGTRTRHVCHRRPVYLDWLSDWPLAAGRSTGSPDGEERRGHHEHDQQHQHHVHERGDVDFGWARARARAASAAFGSCSLHVGAIGRPLLG